MAHEPNLALRHGGCKAAARLSALARHDRRSASAGTFWRRHGKVHTALDVVATIIVGAIGYRRIDNAAHIGGFLTGAAVGAFLLARSRGHGALPEPPVMARLHLAGVVVLLSTAMFTVVRMFAP